MSKVSKLKKELNGIKHTKIQDKSALRWIKTQYGSLLRWIKTQYGSLSGQVAGAIKIGPANWILREYGFKSPQYRIHVENVTPTRKSSRNSGSKL